MKRAVLNKLRLCSSAFRSYCLVSSHFWSQAAERCLLIALIQDSCQRWHPIPPIDISRRRVILKIKQWQDLGMRSCVTEAINEILEIHVASRKSFRKHTLNDKSQGPILADHSRSFELAGIPSNPKE